jgi:hypothetical protein
MENDEVNRTMPSIKQIIAGIAALSLLALPWYVMVAQPRPAPADIIATAVISFATLLVAATYPNAAGAGKGGGRPAGRGS